MEAKQAREFRALEPALETLDTELIGWGLKPSDLGPALAEAYAQSGLFSEHTFGPFAPNGGSWNSGTPRYLYGEAWKTACDRGAYRKYEEAFDDKRAFAHRADQIVQNELGARLDLLARSVKASGDRVVVYNALPWERSGLVAVPGEPDNIFFAEKIPPNGYKTFSINHPASSEKESVSSTLETPFYRVLFDTRRGGIAFSG